MKKGIKSLCGAALSAMMVFNPVLQVYAANHFQVDAEDVGGKLLFPGDSISGIEPIYIGPEGNAAELTEGQWKNETAQAYSMTGIEGDEGGLWLEPKGYVLTVKGGTSKAAGTDGTDQSNHYKPKDEMEQQDEVKSDIACYEAWSEVTVKADEPQEGKIFDHWEVDTSNCTLTDPSTAEFTFSMVDAAVTLSAVYADAPVETEALTALPAETEAPVPTEVITEAPIPTEAVTEAPIPTEAITEAPVPTEPVTEVPVETEALTAMPAGTEAITETSAETEAPIIIEEETLDGVDEENITDAAGFPDETETEDQGDLLAADEEVYSVTVVDGEGSGEYEVASEVAVKAADKEGMVFTGWTTDQPDIVWFADAKAPETKFSMPASAVTITANYEADIPELYQVTVNAGEGGGNYTAGETVSVNADPAPEGQDFTGWTVSEGITLEDPMNPEIQFVMPQQNVELTANYAAAPETQAPETQAPETQAPETQAPETQAPETQAPETQAPETAAPETSETGIGAIEGATEAGTEQMATQAGAPETAEAGIGEIEGATEIGTEQAETQAGAPETEKKSYKIDLSRSDIQVIGADLLGTGGYSAQAGKTVTITAPNLDEENQMFQGFSITRSDTQEKVPVTVDVEDEFTASFIMPELADAEKNSVYVEAVYEQLEDNEVQVINGDGSGTYLEGDYVEISADDPAEGYRFKNWKVIAGDIVLDDETSAMTGFVMGTNAVQVKAVYEIIKYTLTVENGSGDGSYVKGENAGLTADYPASGKEFDQWVVTSQNAAVSAPDRFYSNLTMPAANVSVQATYKDGPSPEYNEIQNIVSGGEYLKGQTISFTAVGNGMNNNNPNPGDYRYRPSGYQIGTVANNWNNAPYTTSMAINAVGEYTLTVTFSKDVFDGNNWVADGTTTTKSVTFYVVNALSVQTGDSSPILPLAVAAAAALIVIVAVVVIKKKRR